MRDKFTPTKKRILIVEDDKDIAGTMSRALERMDYAVVGVISTGDEIVEKVFTTQPDVVLMDVVLDGTIDGIEAGRRIEEFVNVPIIFITGHANIAAEMRSNRRFRLLKPFSSEDLKDAIENAASQS
jgi:CheY-like chemotaxis protein